MCFYKISWRRLLFDVEYDNIESDAAGSNNIVVD